MNRDELVGLIGSGESSGVEFKRDDLRPERVAREIAALLNLEGGHVLLGVEDDGTVSGLSRDRRQAEEWVMEVARTHVRPATIPYWETVEWREGVIVGVVSLSADAPDKPYKAKRGSAWVTQVRAGTTTRDATDEEEVRLYQQSGRLQYDRKPVPGTSFADLDRRRLINYFRDLRQQDFPDPADEDAWARLLVNTEIMAESRGRSIASAAGLLLHAGISAAAFAGVEKDYDAKERATLRGPAVSLAFQRTEADGTRYPRQPRRHGTHARIRAPEHRPGGMARFRRTPTGALVVPAVRGMHEHNGTEPDLIEEDDRFTVRLWKQRAAVDG